MLPNHVMAINQKCCRSLDLIKKVLYRTEILTFFNGNFAGIFQTCELCFYRAYRTIDGVKIGGMEEALEITLGKHMKPRYVYLSNVTSSLLLGLKKTLSALFVTFASTSNIRK